MLGTLFALLYTAHLLADYVLQTDHQAGHKADRTWAGWRANLTHATTHVLTCTTALLIGTARLGTLHLHPASTALALAWIGLTHAAIDRRRGIAWWMNHTGQQEFYKHGGAAHVDQAAHVLALLTAALILT